MLETTVKYNKLVKSSVPEPDPGSPKTYGSGTLGEGEMYGPKL
jgi:hypothetical protein